MFLCDHCFEVFKPRFINFNYDKETFCPRTSCSGTIHEVDENMLAIIITLLEKGYMIEGCCSSHLWERSDHIYVRFCNMTPPAPDHPLPSPFILDKSIEGGGIFVMLALEERSRDTDSKGKHQYKIFQLLQSLYNWAETLPPFTAST